MHVSNDEKQMSIVGKRKPRSKIHKTYVSLLCSECQSGAHLKQYKNLWKRQKMSLAIKLIKNSFLLLLKEVTYPKPEISGIYLPQPNNGGKERDNE